MRNEKVAIIGIGNLPVGKYPESDEIELATLAISRASNDSGLKKKQIDGFFAGPDAIEVFNTNRCFIRNSENRPKKESKICAS